jgi:hypothetical protein
MNTAAGNEVGGTTTTTTIMNTTTGNETTAVPTDNGYAAPVQEQKKGFPWGIVGLIGLIGLIPRHRRS